MLGPAPDPSPDEDLPSDVRFGVWLSTLTFDTVKSDLESRFTRGERLYHRYNQKRLAARQQDFRRPTEKPKEEP